MPLNIGPTFRIRTPDPNAFVQREPDLTGLHDPFTVAAAAITEGMFAAEQKMRDRLEADRAFQFQQQQLARSAEQFDDQHELNIQEAKNLADYRTGSLSLQKSQQGLMREKFATDKRVADAAIDLDQARLKDLERRSLREAETFRLYQEAEQSFLGQGSLSTFSHLGDLRDPEDSGIGFNSNRTADIPGVSINQKSFESAFPGETKDSIMNDFEVDIIDSSGNLRGTLPIVDRGPSDSVLQRQGGQVLDVTAAGIRELGGELLTEGGKITGHTLQGDHTFRVRRKDGLTIGPPAPDGGTFTATNFREFQNQQIAQDIGAIVPEAPVSGPDYGALWDHYESTANHPDPNFSQDARIDARAKMDQMRFSPPIIEKLNIRNAMAAANMRAIPSFAAAELVKRAARHPDLLEDQQLHAMADEFTKRGNELLDAQNPEPPELLSEKAAQTLGTLRFIAERGGELANRLTEIPDGSFGPLEVTLKQTAERIPVVNMIPGATASQQVRSFLSEVQELVNKQFKEEAGSAVSGNEEIRQLLAIGSATRLSEESYRQAISNWLGRRAKVYNSSLQSLIDGKRNVGDFKPFPLAPTGQVGPPVNVGGQTLSTQKTADGFNVIAPTPAP